VVEIEKILGLWTLDYSFITLHLRKIPNTVLDKEKYWHRSRKAIDSSQ